MKIGTEHTAENQPGQTLTREKTGQRIENVVQTRGDLTERDFLFLLEDVKALFELTGRESIYRSIAVSLNRYLRNAIVIVNSFNEDTSALNVRAVIGLGDHADKIIRILGNQPIDVSVPINDVARRGLTCGRLARVPGGIYDLATGTLPRIACNTIEDILSVKGTYAMGIMCRDRLMGSVAILMRDEIRNPVIIETFIDFASVALQRRLNQITA